METKRYSDSVYKLLFYLIITLLLSSFSWFGAVLLLQHDGFTSDAAIVLFASLLISLPLVIVIATLFKRSYLELQPDVFVVGGISFSSNDPFRRIPWTAVVGIRKYKQKIKTRGVTITKVYVAVKLADYDERTSELSLFGQGLSQVSEDIVGDDELAIPISDFSVDPDVLIAEMIQYWKRVTSE